eukprot:TRINITY_DN63884_c0_g1_i1.p1 TRINITY_DN63884_c0_g1~~TRINITY_DN63884_c0_g1_i1.p1  ORF type:complete len:350 (+),score=56.61 TRINITY_DN63884_c0_g1_i1:81-1130(+)
MCDTTWACDRCTLVNSGKTRSCEACGTTASASEVTSLHGHPALQYLPRCAALVQYGGGDDMRQADSLLSLALDISAIPPQIKDAICTAVDTCIAKRLAGEYDGVAAEHMATSWNRDKCSWEVALAVTTEPSVGANWANVYFHGWLFNEEIEAQGANLYAAQRFPLIGFWEPIGGIAAWEEDVPAFGDVRAAGCKGCLRPADQHIHKIDAYAGGDREGTIALYMEAGMDRESAEAAVVSSECESDQFHVGSDCARVKLTPTPEGSAVWVACVDLKPGCPARAQVTKLVLVPRGSMPARWFERWSPPQTAIAAGGDATAARAELANGLQEVALAPELHERLRGALLSDNAR